MDLNIPKYFKSTRKTETRWKHILFCKLENLKMKVLESSRAELLVFIFHVQSFVFPISIFNFNFIEIEISEASSSSILEKSGAGK